mmetsp:Transcript_28977/g.78043  ORF Transcript_28977/g.78043 Transcript_28977/m.78043 type:complete len:205 (+) Transcript_28977:319-933(+)
MSNNTMRLANPEQEYLQDTRSRVRSGTFMVLDHANPTSRSTSIHAWSAQTPPKNNTSHVKSRSYFCWHPIDSCPTVLLFIFLPMPKQVAVPLDLSLHHKLVWVLDHLLESLQELRRLGAIHQAVVAGQVHSHHLLHANHAILSRNHSGLGGGDSQNTGSAWRQDGIECAHAVHAHVGDGEVSTAVLVGAQLLAACPLDKVCPVA